MSDIKTWQKRLERAGKKEKPWRDDAKKAIERYREEQDKSGSQFNILWANTEVKRPALFSAVPKPDIRRRFKEDDPISRAVATVLERAQSYTIENNNFERLGNRIATDFMLPGRAVARVRYVPTFGVTKKRVDLEETEEEGDNVGPKFFNGDQEVVEGVKRDFNGPFIEEDEEELVFEEVRYEHTQWDDFRIDPKKCWEDVTWIAFRHFFTKAEHTESFPDIPYLPGTDERENGEEGAPKLEEVWEIWDKSERKVNWYSESHDKFLKTEDDPLELEGFFPIPEPAYIIQSNGTLEPRTEFMMYKDQADELDDLTNRISKLVNAVKVRGVYAGADKSEISKLVDADDNDLIPVADWAAMQDRGGLNGLIEWWPIEQISKALGQLRLQREELINTIFQITGLSDILRGATDPRETRGAQELKASFGNQRLQPQQREIQRFFRDLFRLGTEVMANHFDIDTLVLISGVPLEEEILNNELFEQTIRNDTLRGYRIDIETDSTIAIDEQKDKEDVVELFDALGGFLNSAGPLATTDTDHEIIKQMILFAVRRFKVGRQMEEMLENLGQDQGGVSEEEVAELEQQLVEAQEAAETAQEELQIKAEETRAEIARKNQEAQAKIQREAEESAAEQARRDRETNQKLLLQHQAFEREQARKDKIADAQARQSAAV